MLDEHGRLNFECEVCKKTFMKRIELIRHQRVHTGEKPFECDICEKKFRRMGGLKIHKRIHTGEKPYKCDICDQKFNQSGHLNVHKRIHTEEKPFKCCTCDKRFRHRNQKDSHERKEHNRPKVKCPWDGCQSEFYAIGNLGNHIRSKHDSTPYHCDQCNRKYKFKRDLDHHKRKHQIMRAQKLLAQKITTPFIQ